MKDAALMGVDELAMKLKADIAGTTWQVYLAASAVSDMLQTMPASGDRPQTRLMAVDIALRQLGAVTPWVADGDVAAPTLRLLEMRLTEERIRLEDLLAIRLPPIPDWRLRSGESTGPIEEPPCPVLADREEAEQEERSWQMEANQ